MFPVHPVFWVVDWLDCRVLIAGRGRDSVWRSEPRLPSQTRSESPGPATVWLAGRCFQCVSSLQRGQISFSNVFPLLSPLVIQRTENFIQKLNELPVNFQGLGQTATNIVQVAKEEHEQKGVTGAVGGVLRQVPATVVQPLILATEATSNVLGGVRNQILPDARREAEDKWRSSPWREGQYCRQWNRHRFWQISINYLTERSLNLSDVLKNVMNTPRRGL